MRSSFKQIFIIFLVCLCPLGLVKSNKAFDASGQIPQVAYAKKAAGGGRIRCIGISCSDGTALVSAIRDLDPDQSKCVT